MTIKILISLVFCLHVNLLFMRTTVWCFNIEQRDPYVKKAPPGQENSYFGFSVALHQEQVKSNSTDYNWLLVGAPLGQNLQPQTNSSGAVFKCPFSKNDQDCIQILTDGQRLNEVDYDDDQGTFKGLLPPQNDEIKNGQWLGVSVRSQRPGGKAIVCAHRYIQSPDLTKFHYGQGLCYLLENNLQIIENPLEFCKGQPVEKLHQQFGLCQLGISASFVGDSAVVGAPGPYTWRGTLYTQVVEGEFMDRDNNVYRGPLDDHPTPIDKYSYLGMSVAGGHIFSKNKYSYVAGATRSEMVGQVYFFDKQKNALVNQLSISLIITGEQFASSFGYEILVVDINNDGLDDVLVGAPFYYSENKGGAVYAYYNLTGCLENRMTAACKWDAVFRGVVQSRFGFAMTSLGDINKDGYNDVAIGAPYEYGTGAVYIYLGSKNGLQAEPSQVIRIRDSHQHSDITTFGYSLSGGLDMDGNSYPDLLVGAYESDRALLYLTRPIIDIKITVSSTDMQNINASRKGCAGDRYNQNNTCFSVKPCFTIVDRRTAGVDRNAPSRSFNVIYNLTEIQKIIPRVWIRNKQYPDMRKPNFTRTIQVTDPSRKYCQEELIYVKEGVSDILSPIKFRVKYTLEDDKTYHTPILNTTSVKDFEATFQKDCGDDDVCESHLTLSAGTNFNKDSDGRYTVDSINKEFHVKAVIHNTGESAYEAKLFVFPPTALSFIKFDAGKHSNVKCSFKNNTLVVCELGNPFHANATAELKLRFNIVKNTKEQVVDLMLKVNSTSKETSLKTEERMEIVLQRFANFTITGKGSTNLFFGGKPVGESAMKNIQDIGSVVIHRYYLYNRGEWDLPVLKVLVQWPYQVASGNNNRDGKWLLYLESVPGIFGGTKGEPVGFCTVENSQDVINPLNLTVPNSVPEEPENLLLPDVYQNDSDNNNLLRKRRDTEYVVQAQEVDRGGEKRRVVVMDCGRSARCVNIECYVNSLQEKNQVYVEIRSRIWNSTLVEDYNDVDWVQIKSNAWVEIMDTSFILKDQVVSSDAETRVYPEIIQQYSTLNWWIIGGAVIAGLLLLIGLVAILWKCGFFKRKRAKDKTLSGNLEKSDESNDKLLK